MKDMMGAVHFFIADRDQINTTRAFSIKRLHGPDTPGPQRYLQVTLSDGQVFTVHENWAILVSETLFKMLGPHAEVVDHEDGPEPGTEC